MDQEQMNKAETADEQNEAAEEMNSAELPEEEKKC